MRNLKFDKKSSVFHINLPKGLNGMQYQKYLTNLRSLGYAKDISKTPDDLVVEINNSMVDNKTALDGLSRMFLRI